MNAYIKKNQYNNYLSIVLLASILIFCPVSQFSGPFSQDNNLLNLRW
jgi:hypothetical protein